MRTGKMRLGNAAPVALDATQMLADLAAAENRARQAEAQLQGAQAATAQHLAAAEASEQDARQAEAQLRKRRAEAESAALQVVQLERQIKDEQRAAEVPCLVPSCSCMHSIGFGPPPLALTDIWPCKSICMKQLGNVRKLVCGCALLQL